MTQPNIAALQALAARTSPAARLAALKLQEQQEAAKKRAIKQAAASEAQVHRLIYLADLAANLGLPHSPLSLFLVANFTPFRLPNGTLIWEELAAPRNLYPASSLYADLPSKFPH